MSKEIIQSSINENIMELSFQMNATNVIDSNFAPAFEAQLDQAKSDKSIRGIILKGSNGFFSNGFDPNCFVGTTQQQITDVIGPAFYLCKVLMDHPLPSAVVINGHAMGYGAILSLFADYRFMQTRQARFGFPEIQIGLPIPMAPAILLQDMIGRKNSRDMVFAAKALKADQAKEWNIVDDVFDDEDKMIAHARKELGKLFKYPRSVITLNKQAFYYKYHTSIKEAIDIDVKLAASAIMAPPGQEGLGALFAGRRPKYDGID